ncbi:MAG: FkbM family methyltransferase [Methylotenera sp.]|nr:FkbM family methyltransferase [Methylotenera sp.]MDD4925191.1 FkbM family methyltransferase [Methylotenera sp.]
MIKVIAEKLGYELIKKKKDASLKSHLQRILKQYEIDLVLDVGANQGQYGKMLRNLGYKGEIISFEPVRSAYEKLKESTEKDNLWKVFKLGLSDKKGVTQINVFKSSVFSSLLKPNEFGQNSFKKMEQSVTEEIDLDTLDNFLNANHIKNKRIFLKMDTQGHDLNVFFGTRNSIATIVGIQSEISFQPIYENMPNYHESLKEYEGAGFMATGLYPVSRSASGAIIEMDCVMLNNKFLQNKPAQ